MPDRLNGPHGVDHADELYLQFYPFVKNLVELNANDESMSKILMSLWKSFIKHGNPSTDDIVWQPIISSTEREYLHLNGTAQMEQSSELQDRMEFWDTLMNGFYDE